jgi:hypothetical protein
MLGIKVLPKQYFQNLMSGLKAKAGKGADNRILSLI